MIWVKVQPYGKGQLLAIGCTTPMTHQQADRFAELTGNIWWGTTAAATMKRAIDKAAGKESSYYFAETIDETKHDPQALIGLIRDAADACNAEFASTEAA